MSMRHWRVTVIRHVTAGLWSTVRGALWRRLSVVLRRGTMRWGALRVSWLRWRGLWGNLQEANRWLIAQADCTLDLNSY